MTSERAFVDEVCAELAEWFEIEREVAGAHCSGRRVRVDAIMRPHDPGAWLDPDPVFAVEFKRGAFDTFDTRDFTRWAAQAVSYTHVVWDGLDRATCLFVCPGVTARLARACGSKGADLHARLLWQLGVGELCYRTDGRSAWRPNGWELIAAGDHTLWTARRGVLQARHWKLRPRVGSGSAQIMA